MPKKISLPTIIRRPSAPGVYKLTGKPSTLAQVLRTYGIDRQEFEDVQAYVLKHLNKKSAHGRR